MIIEVVEPGALTSVQQVGGRVGWRHLGVPVGGAADPWSARLANRLVGNDDGAPLLEATMTGPVLRFAARVLVAVTGIAEATVDGLAFPTRSARAIPAGSCLRIVDLAGARGYLAVGGGIAVDAVLGSNATDLRSGYGGYEGRALRSADTLVCGARHGLAARWMGQRPRGPIRIVPGPLSDAGDGLTLGEWTVGVEADRTGVRLSGPILSAGLQVASMPLPLGAVQIPPDGRPIVMLADRPVTGGYPVVACVIGADVGRVAQLLPGDPVRFERVTAEEAIAALVASNAALAVDRMWG